MTNPVADSYRIGSDSKVYAGMWPAFSLGGNISLDDALAGGSLFAGGAGSLATSFTLTSAATQASAPFTLGHAFKQGDVPSGQGITVTGATAQATILNAWPDGSAKFAVIAGNASLTANTPLTVSLTAGSSLSGSALTTTNLKATGVTASLDCGSFGVVSWATTDWDSPFMTWVTGPQMSSWVYRKPVGSDTTLVAWLEVRLFANGAVEVLPWIENGYLNVAGATNKSSTYNFSLGGTSRCSVAINLLSHQRTPIINGTALSYWLGTDPGVVPQHNVAYLYSTELVPQWSVSGVNSTTYAAQLPTTFTPFQIGGYIYDSDSMGSTGYQWPIGLLPTCDLLYLCSTPTPSLYGAVVRNGYSVGRYGIHYRDENTNYPLKFSDHPNLVVADGSPIDDSGSSSTSTYTVLATGGNAPTWNPAHHPSVGYFAYLLTGRRYFLEETQFATVTNYLGMTDWIRGGGGLPGDTPYTAHAPYTGASALCVPFLEAVQTRTSAWAFRTMTQALCITPDSGDPLRAELINAVQANCSYNHMLYIEQANNIFGVVNTAEIGSYNVYGDVPIWQQDFIIAAWGYAKAMGLPISTTAASKMTDFFLWKARSVVMRLGTSADFWYVNANPYLTIITSTPNAAPDYLGGTGPWLTTDAQVYTATYNPPPSPDNRSSTEGVLGWDYGTAAAAVEGMWGNLQPAISYAIRWGASGAQTGYNRMVAATNWGDFVTALAGRPTWAVTPTIVPSVATELLVSGPTGGAAGVASAAFTLSTDLPRSEPTTVAIAVVGATVTPSVITLPAGSATASFTVTATGSNGARAMTTTNTGRLANVSSTYTVGALTPAWLAGAAVGQWISISGTSGGGGAPIDAYGGLALAGTKLVSACNGGHASGLDNRVVSIDLAVDSPAWTTLMAASSSTTGDVAYYSDGKPASRHVYQSIHYLPTKNKILLSGFRFGYPSGDGFLNMDAFDLGTNTWDGVVPGSPGTSGSGYAPIQSAFFGSSVDGSGNVWSFWGQWKYTTATNTWAQQITTAATNGVRYPWAYDSLRDQMFGLCYGDGEGYGTPGVYAIKQAATGAVQTQITFNTSAAYTQFQTDAPVYAGMDYDPNNDRFLFYGDDGTTTGRIYIITPNSGSVWDMSIMTVTGTPSACANSGPIGRWRYVPALKGFVLAATTASNLNFIRVA